MMQTIRAFIFNPRILFFAYFIIALIATVQLVSTGPHVFGMPPTGKYPESVLQHLHFREYVGKYLVDYNNYLIFKYSYFHLLQGKNLYCIYPTLYWDLYKYSPTFALLMGLLAYLPDVIGLPVWNLINALALFFAIRMLPFTVKKQCLLMWFMVVELLTSLQNAQSNGIMAGLMIAAYGCLQHRKPLWAALWLALATYIKIYGAVGFCLFLFYPGRIKFIAYALFWTILMAALPLAVTSFQTLVWQYHNWAAMMADDQYFSNGLSVMGWLHSWFGVNNGKNLITLAGIVLFFIPFARIKLYPNETYKLLMLSFMLIWVIIFNHKAESPTYIIAVAGAGIWYFSLPRQLWRDLLLAFVFIFTCLAPSDIFPSYIRHHFFEPYVVKAIPCILLWVVIFVELMTMEKKSRRLFFNKIP